MADEDNTVLLDMTVGIVANYVSNYTLAPAEVASLISATHAALASAGDGSSEPEAAPVERPTAAQVRRSVSEKGIVSFLDGRTYKTLKRHLTGHGLDPQTYRQRYGLSPDYPMVAPEYAARRSELAKSIGLGQIRGREEGVEPKAKGRGKAA